MRPSEITDGILAEAMHGAGNLPDASMRPSEITDGIAIIWNDFTGRITGLQ